jgi:hypothetical protein
LSYSQNIQQEKQKHKLTTVYPLNQPHSRSGRKTKKKSKKNVKTEKIIKREQFFPTEVDQNLQTPAYNVAVREKGVKPESLSLPAVRNKMRNNERRKVKNEGQNKGGMSCSKEKFQSFDHETNTCMSEVPPTHLGSHKKRKWSLLSDSGSVQCKSKKRKKNSSQDDILLSESNVANKHIDSGNKKHRKGNVKNHKKEQRKPANSRDENLSETFGKSGSTVKSPYNIHKLKQMIMASNTNLLKKECISENKRVKETGTLRERMLRRLQGSRFRYINEQLYTSGGKDAKEYFEAEPEAFEAYHEGYQQQVQQWPINPLDVIIKALKKK